MFFGPQNLFHLRGSRFLCGTVVRTWEMCNVKFYHVDVTVTVCVSQCCGFLCCTFVGLLKCLKTLHFHVVAWSASLNASPQYRNVKLMEHAERNAVHILLFLYFPAMVRFDKVAMRCVLDVPTVTWLARGRRTSAVNVLPLCYAMKACGGSGGIAPLHDIPMT